jgi:outer membrane murein-binding lipoprotein Lpp
MSDFHEKKIIFVAIIIVIGMFLSGCVDKFSNSLDKQSSPESEVSQASTEALQNVDQNKINELENKINSMQAQIDDLQLKMDRVGVPKSSNKNLIPRVPFRIEVKDAEWQPPTVWTFKENNELEIRYTDWTDLAEYNIFTNNNTIKIKSKKYDYYGLILYDDYVTGIYKNGWIAWVKEYRVIPPKYNSETQMYELN